ncbi:MAG: hypothetical protein ACTSPB_13665 [Candidatus Thorarchaeota archaeon]
MKHYAPQPPTTGIGAAIGLIMSLIATFTFDYLGWIDGSIIIFTFYVTATILAVIGDQAEREMRKQP